jgi:polyphenol oxidase
MFSMKPLWRLIAASLFALLALPGVSMAQNPPDDPEDCAPLPSETAVPFTGDSGPLRTRKSGWDLSAAEIASYKKGWAALRALAVSDPKDPRSWMAQGKVHCWYCGGGVDGQAGEEIHESWLFFPWHRSYLYFMEKILGKMAGDPTLALPYWDWDNPAHTTLPPPFVTPNDASNSLFDSQRGVSPTDQIPAVYVGPAAMTKVLAAVSWETYMGTPNGPSSNGGTLENGPHGLVHVWAGDPTMTGSQDMGVLATAAFDPLFFSHHGNIDRLWDVWLQQAASHTNPPYKSWLDHQFYFYDENAQWRSIKISDVIDHEKSLGYVYAGGTTSVAAKPAAAPSAEEPAKAAAAAPAEKAITLTPEPKTLTVAAAPPTALAMGPGPQLHLEGVSVPEGNAAVVRVFLNKPDATVATPVEDPHFVGYITIVPRHSKKKAQEHAHHTTERKRHVVFDLSADLLEVTGDLSKAQITLVPVGTTEKAKPETITLNLDRVYISQ